MEDITASRKPASPIFIAQNVDSPTPSKLAKKKLLVLDLDETLVFVKTEYFREAEINIKFECGGKTVDLYISTRPGLKEFLKTLSELYMIVVFTASLKAYAELVIKTVQIEEYIAGVFHRDHCKKTAAGQIQKDLAIFGMPSSDIILIDDSPVHYTKQPHNTLLIKAFKGESDDNELEKVSSFLESLVPKIDVRPVKEKYTEFARKFETRNFFHQAQDFSLEEFFNLAAEVLQNE